MTINQKDIITVLGLNPKTHSQLETIILEYASLVQKLKHPEQQSWMFKKGMESNLVRIKRLKSEFKKIRSDVNTTSMDDLIESLNKYKEEVNSIKIHFQPSLNKGLALASFNSSIIYIEEILSIKSRVDKMNKLEDYLDKRETLIKLLGW